MSMKPCVLRGPTSYTAGGVTVTTRLPKQSSNPPTTPSAVFKHVSLALRSRESKGTNLPSTGWCEDKRRGHWQTARGQCPRGQGIQDSSWLLLRLSLELGWRAWGLQESRTRFLCNSPPFYRFPRASHIVIAVEQRHFVPILACCCSQTGTSYSRSSADYPVVYDHVQSANLTYQWRCKPISPKRGSEGSHRDRSLFFFPRSRSNVQLRIGCGIQGSRCNPSVARDHCILHTFICSLQYVDTQSQAMSVTTSHNPALC